jgi:hypothetical protein
LFVARQTNPRLLRVKSALAKILTTGGGESSWSAQNCPFAATVLAVFKHNCVVPKCDLFRQFSVHKLRLCERMHVCKHPLGAGGAVDHQHSHPMTWCGTPGGIWMHEPLLA